MESLQTMHGIYCSNNLHGACVVYYMCEDIPIVSPVRSQLISPLTAL